MKTATHHRKVLNQRLRAAPDLPAPVPRLNPVGPKPKKSTLPRWVQLAWGRSGWFSVQLNPKAVAVFFLYEFHQRSYFVDITHLRRGKIYEMYTNGVKGLASSVKPLEEAEWDGFEVVSLFQLSMSAQASPGGLHLGLKAARPVTAPVKLSASRKRKASASTAELASSESASSAAESGGPDSDDEALGAIAADVKGSSGESSCPSGGIEDDSGLDDFMVSAQKAPEEGDDAAVSDLEEPVAEEHEGDPGGPAEERGPRHPAGTWTIWSSMWVYITRHPKFSDIKCRVKSPLRNAETGLGVRGWSKTITPRHYGEIVDDPVRSILLLRSWSLWRVQQLGRAAARECRRRELDRQQSRLEADLRAALGEAATVPFFGSQVAHDLFVFWVPDLVARLIGRVAADGPRQRRR